MGSDGDMYQIGTDHKIMGWGNATLTPDAKTEVEKYEGVRRIMEEPPLYMNRALAPRHHSQKPRGNTKITARHQSLTKRDIIWKEQGYADEALVMDSQYP
jgi:hypothetical protein